MRNRLSPSCLLVAKETVRASQMSFSGDLRQVWGLRNSRAPSAEER